MAGLPQAKPESPSVIAYGHYKFKAKLDHEWFVRMRLVGCNTDWSLFWAQAIPANGLWNKEGVEQAAVERGTPNMWSVNPSPDIPQELWDQLNAVSSDD